jgi:hypothetical protein
MIGAILIGAVRCWKVLYDTNIICRVNRHLAVDERLVDPSTPTQFQLLDQFLDENGAIKQKGDNRNARTCVRRAGILEVNKRSTKIVTNVCLRNVQFNRVSINTWSATKKCPIKSCSSTNGTF